MKNILIIGLLFCLFASAQAQVSIIPKAGISFSRYAYNNFTDGDKAYIKDSRKPVAGIGVNIPLFGSDFFSLQPELLYMQKGLQYDNTDPGSSVRFERTLNFLEVPVLAKATFGNKLKAYLNAGPSFGYALGGSFTTEARTNLGFANITTSSSSKIKFEREPANYNPNDPVLYYDPKYYHAYEIAAHVGGGVGFQVGPGVIQLDARYSRGITTFTRASNEPTRQQEADGRSRTLAFTIGYAIPLGSQ